MLLTVMGLVFLLCGIGLVCWSEWASIPPLTAIHSDDCKDWSTRGVIDPLCRAPHSTDHFAQVKLLTSLDHQIGFRHE